MRRKIPNTFVLMESTRYDLKFLKVASVTLVLLYLVIIAGSIVRATGSGMGCPDWPKCFGYYIPPTNPAQIEFQESHEYKKSMMIIVKDTLWLSKADFTSAKKFDYSNWEKYPVHNYAKFFVMQTWVEYVNRLIGAVNAFALLALLLVALLRIKNDRITFFVLVAGMCVMAFVIWLGAVVVHTNLAPQKITFHMLSSLALLGVVIFSHTRVSVLANKLVKSSVGKNIHFLLTAALLLTILQIVFGTQVRQQIDVINLDSGGLMRETWISKLNRIYLVHQLTAMVVVFLNGYLFFKIKRIVNDSTTKILVYGILLVILLEYALGVFIHNFSIPAFSQPIHLILALLLFGIQFGLLQRTTRKTLI